jgi:prepilin-type N-terminal cleavage/methylation domain-containing protein
MKKLSRGFTLIEVLVVVLIIGILTSVALPNYQVAVLKARYTELMNVVAPLADAEMVYYATFNKFTDQLNELDVSLPGGVKLSADGKYAYWKKFELHVYLSPNPAYSSAISSTYNSRLMYLEYFNSGNSGGGRQCRAKENDGVANKVCKSLGGTRVANYDGFEAYNLP